MILPCSWSVAKHPGSGLVGDGTPASAQGAYVVFCRKCLFPIDLANQRAFSTEFFRPRQGPEIPKNGSPIPNKPHWRQNFKGANIRYFGLIMVYQGSNNPLTGAYLSLTCRYFRLITGSKRVLTLILVVPEAKSQSNGRSLHANGPRGGKKCGIRQ